jgi:hypothetical protein
MLSKYYPLARTTVSTPFNTNIPEHKIDYFVALELRSDPTISIHIKKVSWLNALPIPANNMHTLG